MIQKAFNVSSQHCNDGTVEQLTPKHPMMLMAVQLQRTMTPAEPTPNYSWAPADQGTTEILMTLDMILTVTL